MEVPRFAIAALTPDKVMLPKRFVLTVEQLMI
jgi:hypothetical protein